MFKCCFSVIVVMIWAKKPVASNTGISILESELIETGVSKVFLSRKRISRILSRKASPRTKTRITGTDCWELDISKKDTPNRGKLVYACKKDTPNRGKLVYACEC